MTKIFTFNTAMSIRAYGSVTVEADTIEAAKAMMTAELVTDKFTPHGAGDDDYDWQHPSDIYCDGTGEVDGGDLETHDFEVADGPWIRQTKPLPEAIQALLDADIYTDAPECQDEIAALKSAIVEATNTPPPFVISANIGAEIDLNSLRPGGVVYLTPVQPNDSQMLNFVRSMANLTTPEDEFADPDLGNKEMYDDIEEMISDFSDDRLMDEYAAFMAMVRDARKIMAGEATADSGHVDPQDQSNVT